MDPVSIVPGLVASEGGTTRGELERTTPSDPDRPLRYCCPTRVRSPPTFPKQTWYVYTPSRLGGDLHHSSVLHRTSVPESSDEPPGPVFRGPRDPRRGGRHPKTPPRSLFSRVPRTHLPSRSLRSNPVLLTRNSSPQSRLVSVGPEWDRHPSVSGCRVVPGLTSTDCGKGFDRRNYRQWTPETGTRPGAGGPGMHGPTASITSFPRA